MRPKVSVIVPIFNTRHFLAKCLRSIAQQSLAEIEIICVDDGSTDGSDAVVAALQATDPRIMLLRHGRNRGLGAARNTGVRAARADYIASVDSDDFIDAGMLKALLDAATAGDFDVVASGLREVNEQGETLRTIIPQDRTIIIEGQHSDVFAITDPSVCTKLWKRSVYTDNNLYFDETTFYEDLGWTYPALLKSRRIRILGAAYYNYLLRPGSTTHSIGWRNLTDHVATFELLRRALVANGVARQHAESFRKLIRQTLKYHAGKALEVGAAGEEQLRYLRCILAIKQAYMLSGDVGDAPPDAPAIIHAIEFDPPDPRDTTVGRQRESIDSLTALVREAALLLRLPLWLSGPLSRSCIVLGRLGRQPALTRYGLRLRRLRRQVRRISLMR
jgi:hypothetical protein